MFKKRAFYLSIALLTVPLVAVADPLQSGTASPVQQALSQLPQACPGLAPRVNEPMLRMLQGLYQGQNDQPLWSVNGRLSALQGALAQLADDGLDPGNYKLPATGDLCADIGISQQYLQALQDLHYGRLQQSRFEPVWHASEVAKDRQARILACAGPGLADLPRAFEQARPQNELYQNLRRVYARQRQQP
ncbi:MAG: murein L,D-transpeptidase, partial [Pseudomonas sp.]|nr:murein L,D-transpeptidase [Pseudomonas sp.]